jgi:hypothetical protein
MDLEILLGSERFVHGVSSRNQYPELSKPEALFAG